MTILSSNGKFLGEPLDDAGYFHWDSGIISWDNSGRAEEEEIMPEPWYAIANAHWDDAFF